MEGLAAGLADAPPVVKGDGVPTDSLAYFASTLGGGTDAAGGRGGGACRGGGGGFAPVAAFAAGRACALAGLEGLGDGLADAPAAVNGDGLTIVSFAYFASTLGGGTEGAGGGGGGGGGAAEPAACPFAANGDLLPTYSDENRGSKGGGVFGGFGGGGGVLEEACSARGGGVPMNSLANFGLNLGGAEWGGGAERWSSAAGFFACSLRFPAKPWASRMRRAAGDSVPTYSLANFGATLGGARKASCSEARWSGELPS